MEDKLYSIKETTLTDIGDALRRKHGETKMETVIETVTIPHTQVIKSAENATIDNAASTSEELIGTNLYVIDFTGANAINVYYTVSATGGGVEIYRGAHTADTINESDKLDGASKGTKLNKTFNESIITLKCTTSYKSQGYYIECTGLDENGNVLTGDVEVEKEVEAPNTYSSDEMAQAIDDIEVGEVLPEEAFLITGNCQYRFTNNGWNWFIKKYGYKITTDKITSASQMFGACSELEEIPFIINLYSNTHLSVASMFGNSGLRKVPRINIQNPEYIQKVDCSNVIVSNRYLRDVNGLFVNEEDFGMVFQSAKNTTAYGSHYCSNILQNLSSLRSVPSWFYKLKLNHESTAYPSATNGLYYNMINNCNSLDEIKNIPVWKCKGAQTSTMFASTFSQTNRVKSITFETNEDGSPIITEWKSQTIDLSVSTGWTSNQASIINYNSGITIDKKVNDDARYQELKNDIDWFATTFDYSRYNHDSAVETINSLPDTSAYLATAGGTNTIKFKGDAGKLTDGGAINTLTAEEIAVATAKGWTVTLA